MSEMTPYQIEILARKQKVSVFRRITMLSILVLLNIGLFLEVSQDLPSWLSSGLVFATLAYIALNVFMAFVCLGIILSLWLYEAILDDTSEAHSVLYSKTRARFMNLLGTGIFNAYSPRSFWTVVDVANDWVLFLMLFVSGHPVLAFLHCGSLVAQYKLLSIIKKSIKSQVLKLNDPLNMDEQFDLDELADRLFNPTDLE